MTLQDFVTTLNTALVSSVQTLLPILSLFLIAIFIFLVGLLSAKVFSYTIVVVSNFLSLESLLSKSTTYKALVREKPQLSLSNFLSHLVYWVTIVIFILSALSISGVSTIGVLENFAEFLPKLVSGSLILLVGILLSYLAISLVSALGALSKFPATSFLSRAIAAVIIVFSLLQALKIFGFDQRTVDFVVLGAIASSSLALGLAGKDIILENYKKLKASKV